VKTIRDKIKFSNRYTRDDTLTPVEDIQLAVCQEMAVRLNLATAALNN